MLPIGIKQTSTIVGSQTLEALMLRSTISCRLEWEVEGIIGCASIKKQISESTALDSSEGVLRGIPVSKQVCLTKNEAECKQVRGGYAMCLEGHQGW